MAEPQKPGESLIKTSEQELAEMEEKVKALRKEYDLLSAQTIMQGLFVNTRSVVSANGGQARIDLDCNYDGKPAILYIESCYGNDDYNPYRETSKEIARLIVADRSTLKVFADVAVNRPPKGGQWEARIWKARNNADWELHGGNPGGDVFPASDLFEGTRDFNLLTERGMLTGIALQHGMLAEVHKVASTISDLVKKPS